MGRRKIAIEPITEERNRSVTFLKRKAGLFKKAHELSVLCSVEVAVVVFGSNRRLYEYCSTDMHGMLSRYGSYEQPHEHKGPQDFQKNKGAAAGGNESDSASPIDDGPPTGIPHQLQHLPHMSRQHTASESPPVQNRSLYGPPGGRATPQPHSRRPSHDASRRGSSNLVPQQHPHPPPPHQQQNGYYMQYNGQVATTMGGPQPYPYNGPIASGLPQQAYLQETRRSSMPAFPSRQELPPPQPPQQPKEEAPPPPIPVIEKRPSIKPRTMFTPIAPSESVLAQHWNFTHSDGRSNSIDVGSISRASKNNEPKNPSNLKTESPKPMRTNSGPPPAPIIGERSIGGPGALAPPAASKERPRLTVTIPSEQSGNEASATESASPRTATAAAASDRKDTVVLPPPSPNVSALLSAGHTGPANPFARPAPTSGPGETPISALPSRFTEASLLPSPSSFFPADWSMMPSPMGFRETPVANTPGFKDMFSGPGKVEENGKRKAEGEEGERKKVKT